jgi:branched-chain amino acid transport system permease protein
MLRQNDLYSASAHLIDMNFTLIAQTLVNGLFLGGVYSLVAVGLTVIFGVMKVVNFAHGSLMMLGMYATFWLYTLFKLDPYLSVIAVLPMLFIIGVVIQKVFIDPVLSAPEHNQLLLTLGLMIIIDNLAAYIWSPNYKSINVAYSGSHFKIGEVTVAVPNLLTFIGAIVICGLVYFFLKKTDLGKALRAASEDIEGAYAVGINVRQMYWLAFGIGSACAGVAGCLVSSFFYISPYVGFVFVITAFVVVVFGGMGSLTGALFGGLIIGVVESFGAIFMPGSLKQVTVYVVFIMILIFKPTGLFNK